MLAPGRNAWRIDTAERMALLIDGDAYFTAFARAAARARRSILVLGWDMDSRVNLLRSTAEPAWPPTLAEFLDEIATRTPSLQVHLLIWDFAMIYALEREPLPFFNLGWRTHPRVHFRSDGEHPIGASHHQKVVVIDDKVAFLGGLDLTKRRWDTPGHPAEDPRRVGPAGEAYQPFHDIMVLLDGAPARALGDLARERWWRATGQVLPRPEDTGTDPWPEGVEPDLRRYPVALARTHPYYKGYPEVREVERLLLDAIASARRCIYIENQYVTSSAIERALIERLREPGGPEVVMVLPDQTTGWLEEQTMDNLRALLLSHLREADGEGRLRVYHPIATADGRVTVKIHAKLLIADDDLLVTGSANLSNRSMGLDTECNVGVEAAGNDEVRNVLRGLRRGLLAEHLACGAEEVAAAERREGSVGRAVDVLRGGAHTLVPLRYAPKEWVKALYGDTITVDPERPVEFDRLIDEMVHEEGRGGRPTRRLWWVRALLAVLIVVGLAAFWRYVPVAEEVDRETLVHLAQGVQDTPMTFLYVLAAYVLGALVMFPITWLIGVTAAVFEPVPGLVYALTGSLSAAWVTFWLGHWLGRDLVARLAGGRLNRLSKRLAQRGLSAVMIVRVLPIAPFTVVNMVAGASHIRFRDFSLGTLLGMAPGILGMTIFVDRLRSVLVDPSPFNIAVLVAVVLVFVLGGVWISRRFSRRVPLGPDAEVQPN